MTKTRLLVDFAVLRPHMSLTLDSMRLDIYKHDASQTRGSLSIGIIYKIK
jgi:hypothetical protein